MVDINVSNEQLKIAVSNFLDNVGSRTPDINHMVDRFLAWPLPADFCPDGGISYNGKSSPIGTNLFTAEQARQMFEYVLKYENLDGYKFETVPNQVEYASVTCLCCDQPMADRRIGIKVKAYPNIVICSDCRDIRNKVRELTKQCDTYRKELKGVNIILSSIYRGKKNESVVEKAGVVAYLVNKLIQDMQEQQPLNRISDDDIC